MYSARATVLYHYAERMVRLKEATGKWMLMIWDNTCTFLLLYKNKVYRSWPPPVPCSTYANRIVYRWINTFCQGRYRLSSHRVITGSIVSASLPIVPPWDSQLLTVQLPPNSCTSPIPHGQGPPPGKWRFVLPICSHWESAGCRSIR